jgi:transposase
MSHDADFAARVALEALKVERTVSELADGYGGPPTMIHQWKKTLLDGATDLFERGSRKPTEVDEETVRSLHAKIEELDVGNDFLSRKLKPWADR